MAGPTFYSFILENLRHFGALKAMGASDGRITRRVLLQAFAVGIIGDGIGLGISCFIGWKFIQMGQPPFSLPYQLPLGSFIAVLLICTFASLLGIRQVRKLEPAVVFRG